MTPYEESCHAAGEVRAAMARFLRATYAHNRVRLISPLPAYHDAVDQLRRLGEVAQSQITYDFQATHQEELLG